MSNVYLNINIEEKQELEKVVTATFSTRTTGMSSCFYYNYEQHNTK